MSDLQKHILQQDTKKFCYLPTKTDIISGIIQNDYFHIKT